MAFASIRTSDGLNPTINLESARNFHMATRHIHSKYLYPPSAACEEKVDSYINELNSLYTQIEGWLPESATSDRTKTLFEYWDGHYEAPANIRS
jgi:hypothetical protein